MGLTVDSERRRQKAFVNWTETFPSLKSRDTKTRTDIKNLLHTKVRHCSVVSESVVICQLSLKVAEEIDFENWRISNFKGLVTLTLSDLGSGHTAYLYLHTKFHRNRKNFLWTDVSTDVRTDVRADGHHHHHHNKCLVPGLQQTGSAWQYKSQYN